jgi:hypothetical protein
MQERAKQAIVDNLSPAELATLLPGVTKSEFLGVLTDNNVNVFEQLGNGPNSNADGMMVPTPHKKISVNATITSHQEIYYDFRCSSS